MVINKKKLKEILFQFYINFICFLLSIFLLYILNFLIYKTYTLDINTRSDFSLNLTLFELLYFL